MENTEDTQEVTAPVENEEIRDPKAVLEALERAKNDAKKYREQFEAMERSNQELSERIAALEGDEGIAKYKSRVIELTAKRELEKEGIKDTDRIFGLMDASAFDLDNDGGLVGFAESLTELKKKLPEVFDTKKRVAGGADAFASEPVKQNLTASEAQVARIFGKG
jgi:hypothetical protein